MQAVNDGVLLTNKEYEVLLGNIKKEEKTKPKMCTSKKILVTVWSISIVLIIVTILGFLFTDKDLTGLVSLTGIVVAAAGTDTAFYSWKAKAENKIKITMSLVEALAEKYGIDSVVSISSSLLND